MGGEGWAARKERQMRSTLRGRCRVIVRGLLARARRAMPAAATPVASVTHANDDTMPQKACTMESRSMRRILHLCVGLVLAMGISSATAQPRQEVDLLMGGEFVVTIDDARPVI